jgi:hypothetical protein
VVAYQAALLWVEDEDEDDTGPDHERFAEALMLVGPTHKTRLAVMRAVLASCWPQRVSSTNARRLALSCCPAGPTTKR